MPLNSRQFIWPRWVTCDVDKGIHQGHIVGKRAMHDACIEGPLASTWHMRYNLRSILHTLIFFLVEEHTIIIKHFYISGAWVLIWFQATLLHYQLVHVNCHFCDLLFVFVPYIKCLSLSNYKNNCKLLNFLCANTYKILSCLWFCLTGFLFSKLKIADCV